MQLNPSLRAAISIGAGLGLLLGLLQLYHLESTPPLSGPTFAEMIRDQTTMPMRVKMLEPHTVFLIEKGKHLGSVEINPGVFVVATKIEDDGVLHAVWAGVFVRVPMDKTDMMEQLWGKKWAANF